MFVMVKYGVPFEVRTESLNIIWTNFGLKGLKVFLKINFNVINWC
jgi:hypothetical protein